MKKILYASTTLMVVLAIFTFRPVPIVSESEALVTIGVVAAIHEGGVKDAVFSLEDNTTRYYINRGLENGLDLASLRSKLIGEEVIIKYPKYGLPFFSENRVIHLSKLQHGDEVIFNELR